MATQNRKLKVFNRIQNVFILYCICPSSTANRWLKIFFIFFTILMIIILIISFIAGIGFFIRNFRIDLESALYSLIEIASGFISLNNTIFAFFMRKQIQNVIAQFQQIFDNSELVYCFIKIKFKISMIRFPVAKKQCFIRAYNRSEFIAFWLIYIWTPICCATMAILALISLSYYTIHDGFDNIDVEKLYVPLKFA